MLSGDRLQDPAVGERAALQRLYPSLRRFAAVVAPSEVGPDDLVQEALVHTLQGGGLERLTSPEAYIRRVMVNLASNHRRRLGRHRRALNRLEAEYSDQVLAAYPSDLVALERLSPNDRAVLYLHEIEGQPFHDIAEQLGQREPTVRKAASRARRQLRREMGDRT